MALLFNGRACEPLLVPADLQLAWARTLREFTRLVERVLDRPAHANGRSPYLWSWSRIMELNGQHKLRTCRCHLAIVRPPRSGRPQLQRTLARDRSGDMRLYDRASQRQDGPSYTLLT